MKAPYCLLFLVALLSCKEIPKDDDIQTVFIDLEDARNIKLSEIVDDIKYVSLNSSDVPLGEGIVKIKNRFIYYWDFQQQLMCVFNHEGDYIGKIDNYGNGPGEYNQVVHFHVNDEEDEIELWDLGTKKIYTYKNLDFSYIDEVPFDDMITFTSGLKLDNGSYLMSANQALNSVDNRLTNAEFYLFDKNRRLENVYFDRLYKGENGKDIIRYSLFKFKLIENDANEIFGSVNYDNVLYHYENADFKPVLKVEFVGGKSIDNDAMLEMSKKEHLNYFTQSNEFVQRAGFPNYEINNPQVTLINYHFKEQIDDPIMERNFFWFKKTDEKIHAKSLVNDLTNFPQVINIAHTNNLTYIHCNPWFNGNLVSVVSPEAEINFQDSVKIEGLGYIKQENNPILLLMRLKKNW